MHRRIAFGAVISASALLMAGCSGGSNSPASIAVTSAAAPDASGAELVIWTDAERNDALATAAKQFEADTGAKVTLVQKNFEDLRNDFIAQVPTGEGPDITVGAHEIGRAHV